jgi:hypothetical protein
MSHRYVGRNRNAGYGYPFHLRLRRHVAWMLATSADFQPGFRIRLAHLVDFDRDRYLEEYADEEGVTGGESPVG